jgi:membrane-bound lytic murein transglycosylase B
VTGIRSAPVTVRAMAGVVTLVLALSGGTARHAFATDGIGILPYDAEGAATPLDINAEELRPLVTDSMRTKLAALVAGLEAEALKRGVSRELLGRALGNLVPNPEIFALLENQPENVATPWGYLDRLVSERRISNGRGKLAEHAEVLAAVEQAYGVDRHIVVAIWGIESNFGASTGSRPVIGSLATLAAGDPRRAKFWRSELLTALTILQRGDIALEQMTGSWAGAMGHTQFMPSSYVAHAVDFDGDGRRDIWGSIPDALASTANYLKTAGWTAGLGWGQEVVLPAGFDLTLTAPGISHARAEWEAVGIVPPAGQDWQELGTTSLLLPAGARGPAFLVSANFRAILRYNNAVPYALAVGHLARRLAGGPGIAGVWPTDDPPLARPGREDLQRRLAALGYDLGVADGIIGQQTRAAIRAFQRQAGLPEDGYPGEALLEAVRKSPAR